MKLIKLILLLLILTPVTLLAILYFTPERINFSKYQPQIEKYIQQKSGYKVSLGQDLKIQIFPVPRFSSKNIEVASFVGNKPLFMADNLDVTFSLENLWAMKLGLDEVLIENPKVYLHKDINSKANWEPKRKKRNSSATTDLSLLSSLGQVVISNAEFVYEDDLSGQQFNLKEGQFSISGEVLQKTELSFSGLLNAQKIESDLTLDLTSLIETSIMGQIRLGDSQINLKGFLDEILIKPSYKGDLSIEGENILSSIYEILHIAPNQRHFNVPLKMEGMVDLSPEYIKLNNYNVQFDVSETPISFDVTMGYWLNKKTESNSLKILSKEHLDLSSFSACHSEGSTPKNNKEFQWSEKIIDFDALRNLNLSLDIELIKGLSCKSYQAKYLKLRGDFEKEKFKMSQFKVEFSDGGNIRGTANIDIKSTPKGKINLNSYKFNIAEFLSKKSSKRMVLPVESEIKLEFSGRTMKEWVSNLSGNIEAYSNGMVLYGVNLSSLNNMLTNILMGGITNQSQSEDYGRFSLDGQIESGVFRSENISILLPDADIIVKGKADLLRMTMNFRAEPNPENTLGFKTPVIIKGSMLSPIIIPDTTTTQKIGATVGGVVAGPAGAALGGVLGAIIENSTKKEAPKTDNENDILKEKQKLQDEVLKFLQSR